MVPFARAVPADGGLDVADVVQRDLESSGRFKGMPRTDMINTPTTAAQVDAAAWKQSATTTSWSAVSAARRPATSPSTPNS